MRSPYAPQFYCEDALTIPNYPLSPLPTYYIPDNGPLQSFKASARLRMQMMFRLGDGCCHCTSLSRPSYTY